MYESRMGRNMESVRDKFDEGRILEVDIITHGR